MTDEIKTGFVCDECDDIFSDKAAQMEHMEKKHQDRSFYINIQGGGSESEVESVYEVSSDNESSEGADDFEIEYTPKKGKVKEDLSVKAQDGVNIKGESIEFKEASAKLAKFLGQKAKRYMFWGKEVHITSVTKNRVSKHIKVEVTTKTGETGGVNLMIYNKGSMRVTKKKGEDVMFVEVLTEEIIKPLLKKIM